MENIKPINQKDTIKNILGSEVEKDNPDNIKFVIDQINRFFSKAINAQNRDDFDYALTDIKQKRNYLGEKYRDSKGEERYIKTVDCAIGYLEKNNPFS